MDDFKSIGAEYAESYADSEEAWEHAACNDQRLITALANIAPEGRAEAATDFGMGFIEPLYRSDLTDDERLTIALLRDFRRAKVAPLTARQLSVLRWGGVRDYEGLNALLWALTRMIRQEQDV